MTDPNSPELLNYRIGILEEAIKGVIENQNLIIKLQAENQMTSAAILKLQERQDMQGKVMDGWARELENHKTTLDMHTWIFRFLFGAAAGFVITKILGLI